MTENTRPWGGRARLASCRGVLSSGASCMISRLNLRETLDDIPMRYRGFRRQRGLVTVSACANRAWKRNSIKKENDNPAKLTFEASEDGHMDVLRTGAKVRQRQALIQLDCFQNVKKGVLKQKKKMLRNVPFCLRC